MAALLQTAAAKKGCPDTVNRLLMMVDSANKYKPMANQPLVEPLSDRELEVLQYLATGMSNQAIADQLFVSLAAVKWHARNIYSKLAVNNRTQAVAQARKLRLVE